MLRVNEKVLNSRVIGGWSQKNEIFFAIIYVSKNGDA
jgi:hypothetical protein